MNIFAMVTTDKSTRYTPYALSSFWANTKLEEKDEFLLIDNDQSFDKQILSDFPNVKLIVNAEQKSFAENVNQVMYYAKDRSADLCFLNNDIIFTKNWFDSLREIKSGIVAPVSNAEFQYQIEGLDFKPVMELDEYLSFEKQLDKIIETHKSQHSGLVKTFVYHFFAIKITYHAYTKIGVLDESFGKGGAEDGDYCLRAHLKDVPVLLSKDSLLLHFGGRSTWRVETADEELLRRSSYEDIFVKKWGRKLNEIAVRYNLRFIDQFPDAEKALKAGKMKKVVQILFE